MDVSLFGIASTVRPAYVPAAAARRPSEYEIKDFVGDQQGVDDMTTSTITLLHDKDTVTLINPFEGTVAKFTLKKIVTKKKKLFWGTVDTESKQYVGDLELYPGETQAVTIAEGEETFAGTGETVDVDAYITLVSVVVPNGGTQYTTAGQPIFGPGGYWSPQNIIKRVRGRRMVVGPMSGSPRFFGGLLARCDSREDSMRFYSGPALVPREVLDDFR